MAELGIPRAATESSGERGGAGAQSNGPLQAGNYRLEAYATFADAASPDSPFGAQDPAKEAWPQGHLLPRLRVALRKAQML
jgi:hypothetical protein